MPHYVNIALGNFLWQAFLLVGRAALCFFFCRKSLLMGWILGCQLFFFSIEKKKKQCAACGWAQKA
jgi:hypothetical protein